MCPFADDVNEPAESPEMKAALADPAYTKSDDPGHGAAVQRVREEYVKAEVPPGKERVLGEGEFVSRAELGLPELPATSELARQAGVDIPSLPEGIAFTDEPLGDFISWGMTEGLSKGTLQSVLDMYGIALTVEGRGLDGHFVERPGDEEIWKERLAEAGLNPKQSARLIAWHRQLVKEYGGQP